MAETIFVTGATGLVGSRVVAALRASGFMGELRAATRRQDIPSVLGIATPTRFDFDDRASVRAAVQGVDALFLATGYSVTMLVQSQCVLEEARRAGVQRIVHLGALTDEDDRHAPLIWHQFVERYVEALGFEFVHLRPSFFMETVLAGIGRAKGRLYHFFGDAKVAFTSVDDIAEVAAAALTSADHAGRVLPLATAPITMAEVAAALSRAWGAEVPTRACPNDDLLPMLLKTGMEPCYAAGLSDHMRAVAEGRCTTVADAFATTRDVLGRLARSWSDVAPEWRPAVPA